MVARIHRPNVLRVYDIFEEDGRPGIVMELIPYPSLRDVLREDGPLSPGDAARVGLGVLAGLRAAHDAGVVHRDVKPANILLGPGGRVVLTDFGIAKSIDSPGLTTSGVLMGSPPYIAPERARGARAGPASDLWGLGASLYAAVDGRPPFQRGSALASLTAVVADEPDRPAHAGPLEPMISGLQAEPMLHRIAGDEHVAGDEQLVPVMRYPDDGQATVRLDRAARPASATGPGVPGRRRPGLAAVAAALAIAVVAAGIAFLAGRPHGHQAASRAAPKASATARAPATATSAAPASAGPASSAPVPGVSSAPAQPAASAPAPTPPDSAGPTGCRTGTTGSPSACQSAGRSPARALRARHGPRRPWHIPHHRPVQSAQARSAGGLAAASSGSPGQLSRLPPHHAASSPLPAGREGRGLGVHLHQEWHRHLDR